MNEGIKAPTRLKDAAKKEWKRVIALVEIDPADVEALAVYCETHAEYLRLVEAIKDEPLTIEVGNNGARQVNPIYGMLRDTKNLLLKYARRFGLDPESRGQKRKTQNAIEDDGMLGLIRGDE